jgi:RNA 2',3'-cyclic 3'-phosphodiesterase
LFIAMWPPAEVLDMLAGLPRPDVRGVRWTTRDQWHVTLRFLGELSDSDADAVSRALDGLAGSGALPVELGPATRVLGSAVLCAPVAGLEALAGLVVAATAGVGPPPEHRRFRGHVTLARGRRGVRLGGLAGTPVAGTWTVEEVHLVRSVLGRGGARYETIGIVPLSAATPQPPRPGCI